MRDRHLQAVTTTMLLLALTNAPGTSLAQASATDRPFQGIGAEASPELRRHHEMQPLMDAMAADLARMRDQMAKGDMTPETERAMAARMRELSDLMSRMSGLIDRPTMRAPERQRQLDTMRKQLDALRREHKE